MSGSPQQAVYFRNLDAIRFIAAMMVLLGHTVRPIYQKLHLEGSFIFDLLQTICNGETGVSIFFVLSGFLITHLLLREWQNNGKISLKDFYIRRVLRIWPLYFAVVFFSFGLYPAFKTLLHLNQPLASSLGYHLLFLSNFDVLHVQEFFPGRDALSQNITWSVSIEEQFYLFWPLIFVFLPARAWMPAILVTIFSSLFFRVMNHDDGKVLYFHTLSVLVDLGCGGLFAWGAFRSAGIKQFFVRSGSKHHFLFMLFSVLMIYFSPEINRIRYLEALSRPVMSFAFALLISAQALSERRSALAFSNWKLATVWGKYTYGIYLLHPVVLTLSDAALRLAGLSSGTLIFQCALAVMTLLFTFVVSKLSYMHFESKFLMLKKNYSALEPAAEKEYGRF